MAIAAIVLVAGEVLYETTARPVQVVSPSAPFLACPRVLVLFDGAWNQPRNGDEDSFLNTNVAYLAQRVGNPDCRVYFAGIGSSGGLIERILSGLFGIGTHRVAQRALTELRRLATPTSHVVIVGSGTGAVSALDLSAQLMHAALPDEDSSRPPGQDDPVTVDLLFLFDMVAGTSSPLRLRYTSGPFVVSVSDNVRQAVHVLAMDEGRPSYLPLHVNVSSTTREVWFRGAHSDIVGGNGNRGRNHLTLRYALRTLVDAGVEIQGGAEVELSPALTPFGGTASDRSPRALVTMSNDAISDAPITIHASVVNELGPAQTLRYIVDDTGYSATAGSRQR